MLFSAWFRGSILEDIFCILVLCSALARDLLAFGKGSAVDRLLCGSGLVFCFGQLSTASRLWGFRFRKLFSAYYFQGSDCAKKSFLLGLLVPQKDVIFSLLFLFFFGNNIPHSPLVCILASTNLHPNLNLNANLHIQSCL